MPARGSEGQGAGLGGQEKKRGDGSRPGWGQPQLCLPPAQALGDRGHCSSSAAAQTELPPMHGLGTHRLGTHRVRMKKNTCTPSQEAGTEGVRKSRFALLYVGSRGRKPPSYYEIFSMVGGRGYLLR